MVACRMAGPSVNTDLMSLLALAVITDSVVHEVEIDVFSKTLSRINLRNIDQSSLSETEARDWFHASLATLKQRYHGDSEAFEIWFNALLDRLAAHVDQPALIHVVEMIFLADGMVHVSEKNLMTHVKTRWNIQ